MSRCSRCGFESSSCFCSSLPVLSCQHRFCLLTHPLEFAKVSNTGKLVRALLPDTLVVNWSRVEPSEALLALLDDPHWQPFLLMPEAYAIYQQAVNQQKVTEEKATPSGKLFILLDATWQQARKMYRQSSYLHTLPLMSLKNVPASGYSLRRNQQAGHLCTAEVAAEILKNAGMPEACRSFQQSVSDFCHHYRQLQLTGKLSD
ncbi:tRNA-uridine aminocarboxypropyltransferase [Endozoicomonas euniceicola]|uniref:tRNA-uridine aminocarboxypropyltransferase n=1 Tax=Endozoicomonas euniceicola TaxID=1234143 RepID=A0ABY6GSS0_9GAMM|nr:DTW domain-containing protein [Endozoicomonas euniceicola]UYM15602.1 DTW domain-containing protein [Endozoicomonas euniceicola]